MSASVKRLLEVVEQTALVLYVLFYDDSAIEDLFCCAPARSKNCSFFCQQFLSPGLESAEDNSKNDLAGMAD